AERVADIDGLSWQYWRPNRPRLYGEASVPALVDDSPLVWRRSCPASGMVNHLMAGVQAVGRLFYRAHTSVSHRVLRRRSARGWGAGGGAARSWGQPIL